MPPSPATRGTRTRRRLVSSPTENSRRTSRPITKKNSAIAPSLTQWRRSMAIPMSPTCTDTGVCHSATYCSDSGELAQATATVVAASSRPALPDSVPKKLRSGPESWPSRERRRILVWPAGASALALTAPS